MLVANPNNALLQKAGNRRGLPHVATQPASAAVRLGPYVLRTAPFNRGNEYVIRAVRADDPTGKLYDITVCPKPEQSANDKQSTTPSNNNPTTVCCPAACATTQILWLQSFFENELHVHRTLARHPCIIAAVDAFENDLFTFIVHEARDVDTDLLKCLTTQGALAEATARVVFIQLAGAIAHSHHRGVVHRDIKLPAIYINSTQKRAYLTGFSYATVLKDQASMLHDRRGSPAYVCPEMLQNKTYDGKAADVWSLAVVLYVMVSPCFLFYAVSLNKLLN